jgi:hypothetical protein
MGTFFRSRAADGLAAMAEVVLPENDFGAPDWKTTAIVPRTFEYLEELPARSRLLLLALFAGVELAAPVLLLCFSRFSRLSKERRLRAIERWAQSRFLAFTLIGDSIKAVLVMMYLSHPLVSEAMGEYKTCAHPEDPLQLRIRPNPLGELAAPSSGVPDMSPAIDLPGVSEAPGPSGASGASGAPEAV